jgi:hypothetical protein
MRIAGAAHSHFNRFDGPGAVFEDETGGAQAAPEGRAAHAGELWLFLHLTLEIISKYRFLYWELNKLLSCHRIIETQFADILVLRVAAALALLDGLAEAGALDAGAGERRALARDTIMVATYWLSCQFVLQLAHKPDGDMLTRGMVNAPPLASPYLASDARAVRTPFGAIPG